ncbi:MAG TPA: hypothetical protein ENN22_07075, partial [bacterium]|nr:hypothetical protein [bacterium]
MYTWFRVLLSRCLILFLLLLPAVQPVAAQTQLLKSGTIWQGAIDFSSMELRIVFKIQQDPGTGEIKASMDSPDQGAAN